MRNVKLICSILGLCLVLGGGSGGTKNLSKERVGNIVVGKTSKQEVFQMFGYPLGMEAAPRPVYKFDEVELQNYLYQNTLKKYDDIPKGQYEVWQYWYAFDHAAPFSAGRRARNAIIIFTEREIVFKKFYSDVYKLYGAGSVGFPQPEFEEMK